MPAQNMCLEHRKSTTAEGRRAAFALVITIVGLGIFQWYMFPWIWQQDRFFVITFLVIEAMIAAGLTHYAAVNLHHRKDFECRIDDERLECVSPVEGCGENFSLSIAEIVRIEKEKWVDSCRWYIWSADGHRYWLTSNYDNPVEGFIEAIRQRVPDITEISS
jgi:hypothetical protein